MLTATIDGEARQFWLKRRATYGTIVLLRFTTRQEQGGEAYNLLRARLLDLDFQQQRTVVAVLPVSLLAKCSALRDLQSPGEREVVLVWGAVRLVPRSVGADVITVLSPIATAPFKRRSLGSEWTGKP